MKKITLFIFFISICFAALAQVPAAITIEPSNATAYDEITLIFDPALACYESGSLTGLSSIAMHSGIALQTGEIWQFEVGYNETGFNGQAATLLPTGDGRYSIIYAPSEYYGFPIGTAVTQICAVFNNGTNWDQDGRDFNPYGPGCFDFFIPLELPEITLELEVFLEGPFDGTEMQTTLNAMEYIPNQQPYNTSPWHYDGDEHADPIPNSDIVDWILIELRETPWGSTFATEETRIARQAAFLLKDGAVVGIDGLNPVTFNLPGSDDLYVFIWHRNHLGIMSGEPLVVNKGVYSYDFKSNINVALDYQDGLKDLSSTGIYGMIAGNGVADSQISNQDKNDKWEIQNGNTGYLEADFNMDGIVDGLDVSDLWYSNAASGLILPGEFVCSGILYDQRDGQSYRTTQIGNQCWMAENINTGNMIDSLTDMSDNGLIEKYCYRNQEDSCSEYGGFYQWNEIMEYGTLERTQGICPDGWHIPSDIEWRILEGYADNQYGIGNPEWEMIGWRGNDAGIKLKSTKGYIGGWNGTDIFKFNVLPAGQRNGAGEFWNLGYNSYFYSSSKNGNDYGMFHGIGTIPSVYKRSNNENYGFCLRCIKDVEDNLPPSIPTSPLPNNQESNISDNPILYWWCLDPENDLITYDIYFGPMNPPSLISEAQPESFLDPGTLLLNTDYYWKVVASDNQSNSTLGPIWNFKTKETSAWVCNEPITDPNDGQIYQTIKIGNQCWMSENLNIGTQIDGIQNQIQNGIIEKYCFENLESNCNMYGGLYQWDEMMGYLSNENSQGICPEGWHIPSDEDLCILEDTIDDWTSCNIQGWSGKIGGIRLQIEGTSGFNLLMAGFNDIEYGYWGLENENMLWTSTEYGSGATGRYYNKIEGPIYRFLEKDKFNGFSVRCLKNNPPNWSCGDLILDARDGQEYSTVEIGNQCWMAENMNIGNRVDGIIDQTDNDLIEKYCFDDLESNCDFYGGLYQWNETMQYTVNAYAQGVCPSDWHIPDDIEWKILEGTVDSQFRVGDPEWDNIGYRGFDAGKNLKATSDWSNGGNGLDLFGFASLPAGYRYYTSDFYYQGDYAYYWISEEYDNDNAWKRYMHYSQDLIDRDPGNQESGFSIRCIQNYINEPPVLPWLPQPESGSIDIEIDTTLHWTCYNPEGNDLTYSIYFGTETDPPYIQGNIPYPWYP